MKKCLIALCIILVGCVAQQRVVTLTAPFDAEQATKQMQPGKNKVEGNAFMRQMGGGVVTCAGSKVILVPVTEYATERMVATYGSSQNGHARERVIFTPERQDYLLTRKETTCDSQGKFEFDNLSDGDYYIVTAIQWAVGYEVQGGGLMQRVSLHGGKTGMTEKIIMSR